MPFQSSIEGNYAFGKPYTFLKSPADSLNNIARYLRGFMADFRNPGFYDYHLDGDGKYIFDGGYDMFDKGNVTTPWLLSGANYTSSSPYTPDLFPSAVDYATFTPSIVDTDFNYVSLGYTQFNGITQDNTYLPLTVLASRTTVGAPVGWQVGGNSGADGGGTLASGILYAGDSIQYFNVHAFYREIYGVAGPSHCNLYILLGHPYWDSVFGSIHSFADPVINGGCGGYFYTSGPGVKNILALQTLLSKPAGGQVTAAECRSIVQAYCYRIRQALGF